MGSPFARSSCLIQANRPRKFFAGLRKFACDESRPINPMRRWLTIAKKLHLNQLREYSQQHQQHQQSTTISTSTSPGALRNRRI